MIYLKVIIDVKFRAFGIDFGKKHEEATFPLFDAPFTVSPRMLWSVNRNGVVASISIVQSPILPTDDGRL